MKKEVVRIEPPRDAWFTIGAHKWATNGHVLIRKDGPRPTFGSSWLRGDKIPPLDSVLDLMRRMDRAATARAHGHIDSGYLPLVEGAECRQGTDPLSAIVVERGGEIVAYVMPVRGPDRVEPRPRPRHERVGRDSVRVGGRA